MIEYSGLDLLLVPVVNAIKVLKVFWFHAFKGFHPSIPSNYIQFLNSCEKYHKVLD